MAPLQSEWTALRRELASAIFKGKGSASNRDKLAWFQSKSAIVTVINPACGSGNFLYMSLQLFLGRSYYRRGATRRIAFPKREREAAARHRD